MVHHFKTIQWKKRKEAWNQLLSRLQAHKGKNCVLPDGHQLHGCQIHVIWWTWHTSDTPFITITSAAILTQVTITFTPCISTIHRIISRASLRGLFTYRQEETSVWTSLHQTPWHRQRTHTWTFSTIAGNVIPSTIQTGEISQSKSQTGFQHYALNFFQDPLVENWKLVQNWLLSRPYVHIWHTTPSSCLLLRPLWFITKSTHFETLLTYKAQNCSNWLLLRPLHWIT